MSEQAATLARYQGFESLNADLQQALRRIPAHEEFTPPAIDYQQPTSFFLSDEQYELEQQAVFRRLPVVATLSSRLREPGSVLAHDGYGVPMVLTRDTEGQVRAFLNVCTHKGAILVEDNDVQRKVRMTCPYHAWSFGLDGHLAAVPREESFSGLNKSCRGLAELPCAEIGGLIWVILDRNAPADFSQIGPALRADLSSLELEHSHLYGHKTFHLDANWKLVMEPFLEAYHVRRLHARSVGPMFKDVSGVCDIIDGHHIRQISGRAEFEPHMLDGGEENVHKVVTMTWQLLPSTVLICSPYYISVMVVIPAAPDKTRVEYHMLTRTAPDNDKAEELYARSYEMILDVFGNEDFRASQLAQRGLETGAITETVYCGMEENIPRYYDLLQKRLAEVAAP